VFESIPFNRIFYYYPLMDSFSSFHFSAPIEQALQEKGYTKPTPIQVQAIPPILSGRDVIGIAQTGTGKTAAFALPILQLLSAGKKALPKGTPRVLVLAPTRELAHQIMDSFATYGKHLPFTSVVLYGGVSQGPQEHALSKGVDIVVATPGRLLDLMRQKFVQLEHVEVLVLDEADRMLEMGFQEDIKHLIRTIPHTRQTLLFSATLSPDIEGLAKSYLRNPVDVKITAQATTVEKTKQSVLFVDKEDKNKLLELLLQTSNFKRVIVFTLMKHVADKVVVKLNLAGIKADALHSDKTQAERARILQDFRSGALRVLVATDIAARGIDVDEVTHVINFDLPKQAETYVHRIGRTARAGAEGTALTFCTAQDRTQLKAIEALIGKKLTVREHKYHSVFAQNGGHVPQVKKPVPKPSGRKGRPHLARSKKDWKQK
jgi:ATP-dependent RNA helicase RhlE